ncbi:MAG: 4Fe-4S dicluster domain-containing protein [Nitrospira sp.]|nr:4Fe-4S dicluster domain-containing protein [Nitrospira sp.]
MCEFCTQHGEGKKWYLNVKNYATELLNDPKRRYMIKNFYKEVVEKGNNSITRLEMTFQRNPKLLERIKEPYIKEMKSMHFGQVVPLEDIIQILSICNTTVRLPCGCRWAFNKQEARVCFGISFGLSGWYDDLDIDYFGLPDVAQFDRMDKEQVIEIIKKLDNQGMIHSIWTFQTPFIGAICNCELKSCLAMRSTVGLQMPIMFKAEELAEIDAEKCTGCQECSHVCQFNAIEYSEIDNKSQINAMNCFGCGVCRGFCPEEAIYLVERRTYPVASSF